MTNEKKSKAYLDGVQCANEFLSAIASAYVCNLETLEDERAEALNSELMEYAQAVTTLSGSIGRRFLVILPEFFMAIDREVPKSIRHYLKRGNPELIGIYLFGFHMEAADAMDDWEEFLVDNEFIELEELEDDEDSEDDPGFDPELVQQVLAGMKE